MSDDGGRGINLITSIEASEEALQLAEGRAMAVELLAAMRKPGASPQLLQDTMKREAVNVWSAYRFRGLCMHLQEELSRSTPADPAPQRS